MKHPKNPHHWVLVLLVITVLSSCGVKGPPLPPVPASAELSDAAAPEPTSTPGR